MSDGLFGFLELIFGKREPEYPFLEAYLDMERQRPVSPEMARAGLIAGVGAPIAVGLNLALLLGTGVVSLALVPIIAFAAVTTGAFVWASQAQTRDEKEVRRLVGKAKAVVEKLYRLRRMRRLRRTLGDAAGGLLDAGARAYIECKQALASESWTSHQGDSLWGTARDRAMLGMDAAMAKLLLTVDENVVEGADYFTPRFHGAEALVREMREMANEASRLAARAQAEFPSTVSADPAAELRTTLEEIRKLEVAEAEVERLRHQG
ncbi:MAG: hypothetical protein AKCLJLPJ_01515 [Fimbriimonadales bacterium]|nr:hypothetical protein [Armatimonadota bacterium]MBV6503443.1 hypothetical protein [Fimbriimonadales bacterium]NOG93319.1 hypothetical protein [Armatimonadota bacterium]